MNEYIKKSEWKKRQEQVIYKSVVRTIFICLVIMSLLALSKI